MRRFWDFLAQQFGPAGRWGLVAGVLAIIVLSITAGFWLLRTDYQVLFAGLSPQDTGAMTAELDRLKTPYILSDDGEAPGSNRVSILVDRNEVYKTRIKLMGKDIPLHGAVGFELFNNSDLGMTEFAQKISYQRALQGELTRTILALDEIQDARVLLALPEQGLFKQATSKPKASVTLTLKPGRSLRSEQVQGVQRLVAAAVPGILTQDVTIVDQSGVALTRAAEDDVGDSGAGSSTARLDLKKDTESYLSRKAILVLERALGQGQATASVDVTLNMDRVQSNTDEFVGAPGKPGAAPTGVVTREKDTSREVGPPLGSNGAGSSGGPLGGSNQHEVEYAVGHRVEQVISQPGSVRRIQVAVVVRNALSPDQQEQLRKMVAAAVGASIERGDAVVVQTVAGFVASGRRIDSASVGVEAALNEASPAALPERVRHGDAVDDGSAFAAWRSAVAWGDAHAGTVALVVMLVLGLLIWGVLSARRGVAHRNPPNLSEREREELLSRVQAWMQEPTGRSTPAVEPAGAPLGEAGAGTRSPRMAK